MAPTQSPAAVSCFCSPYSKISTFSIVRGTDTVFILFGRKGGLSKSDYYLQAEKLCVLSWHHQFCQTHDFFVYIFETEHIKVRVSIVMVSLHVLILIRRNRNSRFSEIFSNAKLEHIHESSVLYVIHGTYTGHLCLFSFL